MNIHEYQAKQLLARHGVAVPPGEACDTPESARVVAQKLFSQGHSRVVVKSQIHAGGRGKGTFKSGFQGGIKLCRAADEVLQNAKAMLGQVLVEAAPEIQKELYLAVLVDRASGRPLFMASTEGGMEIEDVAAKTPEKIHKELIDPAVGMMAFQARKLAAALGLRGALLGQAAKLFLGIYQTFWNCDAALVEINPLCLVTGQDGQPALLAVDTKLSLDDNALFRHKDLQAMRDFAEEADAEIEASKHDLSYIQLDGNIACLVNGAGLAMATMDIIKHYGGNPANFLDVGGGATLEQVRAALTIILGDPNVQAILVNIFGGIMQCDVIAAGIVDTLKDTGLKLPLVVRLEGNSVQLGQQILRESGLPIINANSMADAAQKVVAAVRK
jgi:succinyl-CoA synthetase beta subunit